MTSVTDIGNWVDELLGSEPWSQRTPFYVRAVDTRDGFPYFCDLWRQDGRIVIDEKVVRRLAEDGMPASWATHHFALEGKEEQWKIYWGEPEVHPEVEQNAQRVLNETYERIRRALVPHQPEISAPSKYLIDGK